VTRLKSIGRPFFVHSVILLSAIAPALAQNPAQNSGALRKAQSQTEALAKKAARSVVSLRIGRNTNPFAPSPGGSGFIISKDGWIVSTAAVVGEEGEKLQVTFCGGVGGQATVVGVDPISNLALLKVDRLEAVTRAMGAELQAMSIGRSGSVKAGEVVFTVTDSFRSLSSDGEPSFSMGLVSRVGRLLDSAEGYRGPVFETDAAINDDSFGGPLINLRGEAIGVVMRDYSKRRWHGTAIPVDSFSAVRELLARGQRPAAGKLGFSVADRRGLAELSGVEVLALEAGSAAADAGLKAGDRITAVDGRRIYDADDLNAALAALPPGVAINLSVRRAEKDSVLDLVLQVTARAVAESRPSGPNLGLSLARSPAAGGGLTITRIAADSPLKGIAQVGDVLKKVEGVAITDTEVLRSVLAKTKPGQEVTLVIAREGWGRTVKVRLSGEPDPETRPETSPPALGAGSTLGVELRESKGGLEVTDLKAGGPAAKAGLKAGDRLIYVLRDSRKLALSFESLGSLLASVPGGTVLRFGVERSGWQREIEMTTAGVAAVPRPWLGVGLKYDDQGALITRIDSGSPLAKLSLKVGDRILAVNAKALRQNQKITAVLKNAKVGDVVKLKIERDGWEREVQVTLAAAPKQK
jgi:S1-C subfamily serine protease